MKSKQTYKTYRGIVTDNYFVALNDPETYKVIARILMRSTSFLFSWTPFVGSKSQYMILLVKGADYEHENRQNLQRGLQPEDLFVTIFGLGSFGFAIYNRNSNLHGSYVAEKLNVPETEKDYVAELLSGILRELNYEGGEVTF